MPKLEPLEQLISSAASLVADIPEETPQQWILVRPPPTIPLGTMSMIQEETHYPPQNIASISLGAIIELASFEIDASYRTKLLKDATWEGTMIVDQLTKVLPDFSHLKSVSIKPQNICYHFGNPIDIPAIKEVINQSELSNRVQFYEGKKGTIEMYLDEKRLFSFKSHLLLMQDYRQLSKKELGFAIKLSAGLVTRIHQDNLFRGDIRRIYLREYQPVFKMLFPESFEDQLTSRLKIIRSLTLEGKITEQEAFKETRKSQQNPRNPRKVYSLGRKYLPEHVKYLIVTPSEEIITVRFGSKMDLDQVYQFIKSRGWETFEEERPTDGNRKANIQSLNYDIRKGGGRRTVRKFFRPSKGVLVKKKDQVFAKIQGDSILTLYLSNEDGFKLGSELLKTIFYQRLLYTSSVRTMDLDCDLTPVESQVIGAVNNLVDYYNLFLSVDEAKATYRGDQPELSPIGWVINRMRQSTDQSFPGRILNVLDEIYARVNPHEFQRYGSEPETQERLRESYNQLRAQMRMFEAMPKT